MSAVATTRLKDVLRYLADRNRGRAVATIPIEPNAAVDTHDVPVAKNPLSGDTMNQFLVYAGAKSRRERKSRGRILSRKETPH